MLPRIVSRVKVGPPRCTFCHRAANFTSASGVAKKLHIPILLSCPGLVFPGSLRMPATQAHAAVAAKTRRGRRSRFYRPQLEGLESRLQLSGTLTHMGNVQVTVDVDPNADRSESSLAANPLNPLNMIGASQRFFNPANYHFTLAASTTFDAGRSLTQAPPLPLPTHRKP